MRDIKQAELWLKYLFFPVSAAHSVSSAQTLQLKRQQSTHMLEGVLPDYSKQAFSWKLDIFWQFHSAYDGYPKRKLAFQKKEYLFSGYGGLIKKKPKIQAFPIKPMHRRKKKVIIMALLQNTKISVEDTWVDAWIGVSVLQIMQF